MMAKCPRQFYYRYVEGFKIKPNSAMKFGSAYHSVHESNFNEKISVGEFLSLESMLDLFKDRWTEDQKEVEWEGEPIPAGKLLDIGVMGIAEYYDRILPSKDPALAEYEFEIQLPEVARSFVGIIDYVGKDGTVTDHKTASRKWPMDRVETEMQPSAYYLGMQYSPDKLPEAGKFKYEVIVKKNVPEIQVLETTRTQQDLDDYVGRIRTAERLIDAEIFPKTEPGNWYCSNKWCGYYPHCMQGMSLRNLPQVIY